MDPLNPDFRLSNRVDRVAQALGVDLFRLALVVERDAQITLMTSRWPGRDDTASVQVKGSGRHYLVRWQVEFDRLLERLAEFRSHCECGQTPCDHAVAAWLRTLFLHDAELARRWRGYGEPQQQGLSRATSQWIAALDEPTPIAKQATTASDEVILYLLIPSRNPRYLDRIETVKVKCLVKGGYGKNAKTYTGWLAILPVQPSYPSYGYQRYSGYGDPHFINDADRALAKQLYINEVLPVQGMINLADHELGHLLIDIVSTGRLVFPNHQAAPLTLGPERNGSLTWQSDADARWRLGIAVTPATNWIIATNPPWYLDLDAGCIGPIHSGLSKAVLRAVLTAPAVDAEELGALTVALGRHGSVGQVLPPPPTLTTVDEGTVRPVPVLQLTTMEEYRPFGGRDVVPIARVSFDYHGKQYAPGGPDRLLHTAGNAVTVQHRDREFELNCIDELANYDLLATAVDDDVLLFEDATLDNPMLRCLQFQHEAMAELQQQGWRIEFANDFQIRLAASGDWQVSLEDAEPGWFDAALGVEIDGKRIDLVPLLRAMLADDNRFRAAVKNGEATSVWYYPLSDQRWIAIPAERVRQLAGVLLELEHQSSRGRLRVSRFELAGLDNGGSLSGIRFRGAEQMQQLATALHNETTEPPADLPQPLLDRLRPYQRTGVAFLQGRLRHDMGVILADDMGLGKTVQVLSHVLAEVLSGRAADKPSLVVVPRTLLAKWVQEQQRFTPALRLLTLHGAQRATHYPAIPRHHVVVTTYELLVRDAKVLHGIDWHIVALDEGHRIRNPDAQQSQAAYGLRAKQRIVVSGTPMQNRLEDLWSMLNFAVPGLLRSLPWFRNTFCRGADSSQDATRLQYQQRLTRLGALISPFRIRRTKADVQNELPPITEVVRAIRIDGPQRDLYETVRARLDKSVRDEIAKKGIAGAHLMILAAITQLRQVCCDPALLKLDGLKQCPSAKLQELEEIVQELMAEGHRPIIYSSFAQMLAHIATRFAHLGISYSQITGQTRDREAPQQQFKTGKVDVLLLSLKAAGEGIDLPEADTVILYDPWWNPFAEEQAIARAHRSGQQRNVLVMRLVVEGSLEEGVLALADKKRSLVDAIFKGADEGLQKLSLADIDTLLAPMH